MKTLDKPTIAERNRLADEYDTAATELETAIEEYNNAVHEAYDKVEAAKDKYNSAVSDLKDWAGNVAQEIQEFIDDHGDKWQEGERGQAYSEWQSSYESFEMEDFTLEAPDDITMPDDVPGDDGPFSELSEDIEI